MRCSCLFLRVHYDDAVRIIRGEQDERKEQHSQTLESDLKHFVRKAESVKRDRRAGSEDRCRVA